MKLVNLGGITNSYLLQIKNGYLLVDTGYPSGYRSFCKKLEKLRLSPSDISTIFLTHAHDDHAGFLNELLKNTYASVIIHPSAVEGLRRGQNSFSGGCSGRLALFFCKLMALAGKGEHRFPSIETQYESRYLVVTDETRPSLEDTLGCRIIETPGHTACSISLLTKDGDLLCGDAAMNGFPSRKRATIWIEDLDVFCASWKKIISLKPKTLYPGHGKPFPVAELARYLQKVERIRLYALK